ncbi:MAG: diguanylate cyclase [Lachnospiraceae bacterium]|nr:diguanylate cyclase [Lachnospiraceae bacterium]
MRVSIRIKTSLMIAVLALVLGGVALTISGSVIDNMVTRAYFSRGEGLAGTVSVVLDGEQVRRLKDRVMSVYQATEEKVGNTEMGSGAYDSYIARFSDIEKDEDFLALREQLLKVQRVNDVDCLYLVAVDKETDSAVYLVDAAEENDCPPGSFDPIYDFNAGIYDDPERGFPAFVTDTEEYGELVTAGAPVHGADGSVVAYALVDIVMGELQKVCGDMIRMTGITLLILTLVVCILAFIIVEFAVVRPIRKISEAAVRYCHEEPDSIRHGFYSLKIHTGDEIEDLADSMKKMESDINDYFSNLLAAKQELLSTREEAERMNEIANLDELTGVRNKRAYELEMSRLEKRMEQGGKSFGLVVIDLNDLKKLNDHYGHEMGDQAIRKLCGIICGVFAHSPVFRYGGDEFVVILERSDYENADELMQRFESMILCCGMDTKLNPWERIQAAAGMAIYDMERDRNPAEVFRRADRAMYAKKQEMKAEKNV